MIDVILDRKRQRQAHQDQEHQDASEDPAGAPGDCCPAMAQACCRFADHGRCLNSIQFMCARAGGSLMSFEVTKRAPAAGLTRDPKRSAWTRVRSAPKN